MLQNFSNFQNFRFGATLSKGVGVPPLMPPVSATVAAVYAMNLVVAGYTGPLFRLVRPSDSA